MSPQKNQYKAYSLATRTVAKSRQVVMLYDGAIRFLKQASVAIEERRIEDRFRLLVRASDILTGLQSCIDFDSGGEVAPVLHRFYTHISSRVLSANFKAPEEGLALCGQLIEELKQMRDAWEGIDHALSESASAPLSPGAAPAGLLPRPPEPGAITLSA